MEEWKDEHNELWGNVERATFNVQHAQPPRNTYTPCINEFHAFPAFRRSSTLIVTNLATGRVKGEKEAQKAEHKE